MSIVDTWDWDKLKLEDFKEEESTIRCECCGHKFGSFEYFVVVPRNDDEEFFMCEECFFSLAMHQLGCREVKMNHDGTDYYDPSYNDVDEEWDKEW